MRLAPTLVGCALSLLCAACGKDEVAPITAQEQQCVLEKEQQAIREGRLDRENPGTVAAWALRECGIDPKRATRPFAERKPRRSFEPAPDNLRVNESSRPLPPDP